MKLATTGLLPKEILEVDHAAAERLRWEGFVGCSCFFEDFTLVVDWQLDKLRQTLWDNGVGVAQVNGRYEALVNPDNVRRQAGIAELQAGVQVCARLQGDTLYVRPGSMHPEGRWWPHPENHDPATLDRLVDSLRQVARTAEDAGVVLALGGHTTSPLNTAAQVRSVIDRVDSPALKFNLDPVNFVSCVQDVYNSRQVIDTLFDQLGDLCWTVHAKDVTLDDKLVVHISETVIGRGYMDLAYLLQRFQAMRPEGYVIIEHLPDELMFEARDSLLASGAEAGTLWDEAPHPLKT